jgi:hypothetical protein
LASMRPRVRLRLPDPLTAQRPLNQGKDMAEDVRCRYCNEIRDLDEDGFCGPDCRMYESWFWEPDFAPEVSA